MPLTSPQSHGMTVTSGDGSREQAGRRQRPLTPAAGNGGSDVCEVDLVDHEKVARARSALPDRTTLVDLAEMLRALGDPTRLEIVCALNADGVDELCVCDLATLVGVSDSAVSHSLRTLRQLGVVRYRKDGKIAFYSLNDAHVAYFVRAGVRHSQKRLTEQVGRLDRGPQPDRARDAAWPSP